MREYEVQKLNLKNSKKVKIKIIIKKPTISQIKIKIKINLFLFFSLSKQAFSPDYWRGGGGQEIEKPSFSSFLLDNNITI